MTPTATKTKPSVEDGLAERTQKLNEARAEASALATEHTAKLRQARALDDGRRQLIRRDPELVDHLNVSVGPDNPVGEIDKQIAALGDLGDLARRVEHASRIERSAKQSWDDFVASHYSELLDLHRAQAAAVADEANEAARAFTDKLREYLEFHSRIAGYTVPVSGITTHVVPGLEAAVSLLRVAESVDLKPPNPRGGFLNELLASQGRAQSTAAPIAGLRRGAPGAARARRAAELRRRGRESPPLPSNPEGDPTRSSSRCSKSTRAEGPSTSGRWQDPPRVHPPRKGISRVRIGGRAGREPGGGSKCERRTLRLAL
jgi:hypothetical protein